MNETKISEAFIDDFFPCTTMRQVQFAEMMIFGLTQGLTSFIRDVTPAERAAGIINPHALVEKTTAGITRKYGAATLLKHENP